MTCIAAIIDGKGIGHIACDSLGSNASTKGVLLNRKIFVLGDMLVGYTGSFRMGQLLQYRLALPTAKAGQSLEEWLHIDFIDAVRELFLAHGFMRVENGEEGGGTFLIVVAGRIFKVQDDLSLLEPADPFEAAGSGEDYARATMNACAAHGITKPDRVLTEAIESASKYVPSVGGDIYLLSEKDSGF